MRELSILMPVYNERATVERAIEGALAARMPVDSWEVVVVDDGSTDGTRELLRDREWPSEVRGSAERLHAATGWAPEIPLERTLADAVEWWAERLRAVGPDRTRAPSGDH